MLTESVCSDGSNRQLLRFCSEELTKIFLFEFEATVTLLARTSWSSPVAEIVPTSVTLPDTPAANASCGTFDSVSRQEAAVIAQTSNLAAPGQALLGWRDGDGAINGR